MVTRHREHKAKVCKISKDIINNPEGNLTSFPAEQN